MLSESAKALPDIDLTEDSLPVGSTPTSEKRFAWPSAEGLKNALAIPSGSLVSEWGQRVLQENLASAMPDDALSEVPRSLELLESASEVRHSSGHYRISDAISVDSSLIVKKSSFGTTFKDPGAALIFYVDTFIFDTNHFVTCDQKFLETLIWTLIF